MAGNELDVRTPKTVKALVTSYEGDFSAILPRHATVDAFMGLAVAYTRRDKNLRDAAAANPASFIIALRECAALGHMPMRGTYSLVPFKSRALKSDANPFGWEINGIEEVRGTIQRMFRAGGVTSVHVQLVHAADQFEWSPARMTMPIHEFDWKASDEQRGPIDGVYAWARLRGGGTSQVVVMNMQQVHRYEAIAKTDKFWQGPWRPEMVQKTALHRLEKFVPTSAEYLWNFAAAEAGSAAGFPDLPDRPAVDPGYDDVQDAEIVEDGQPVTPQQDPWPETAAPGGGTNA